MKIFNLFTVCAILLMVSCNTAEDIDVPEMPHQQKSRMRVGANTDFAVSEQLLLRYVNSVSPNKAIEDITPIIRNTNDTLAFIVQYTEGWDLISADTRIMPNLACSEVGVLDSTQYNSNGDGGIVNILNYVEQIKQSSDTTINTTWKFFQPNASASAPDNGIAPYADVAGMWIPVDTQYVDDGRYVSHLISTHWHQDAPYNNVCPLVYLGGTYQYQNSYAGCGPIACGQVIYQYLKTNNPHSVVIPANCVTGANKHLVYSNFSTSQWTNLTTPGDNLSIYITYLGQEIMGAEYIPYLTPDAKLHREVGVNSDACCDALDWAHFQYSQSEDFNWQNIVSSLLSSHPIIVTANDASLKNGHVFIIDAINKTDLRAYITYEWRDGYHPTDWELQTCPGWMFETAIKPDFKGDGDLYEEEVVLDSNIKIAMNWGHGNSDDNIFYLLRDGSNTIAPAWTANGITYSIIDRVMYNIRQ